MSLQLKKKKKKKAKKKNAIKVIPVTDKETDEEDIEEEDDTDGIYMEKGDVLIIQQFPLTAGSFYTSDVGTCLAGSFDELICQF